MNILETFKTAFIALNANKVRSILTMLGVIIGVFSIISLVALGRGIQNYITDQFNSLGSNLIFVAPGKINFADDPAKTFSSNKLSEKHIALIEVYAKDYVTFVTPSIRVGRTVYYKNKDYSATIIGANENLAKIFNIQFENGRLFNRNDVKSKKKLAVIAPLVNESLFGGINPIGKKIKISDDYYEIIGISQKKSRDFDDNIYVPHTSLKDSLSVDKFSSLAMKVKDTDYVDIAMSQVKKALLRDLKEDDFSVLSQQDVLSSIQNILRVLTLALGAIAGVSLLVGGIGIMNIMLVSVTERISEIGLRKALGATRMNIALQFLTEAVILSVGGGTIGLILGWISSVAAQRFVRAEVTIGAVILAFGFSVAIGTLFGTYPALKASKMDPVTALRYE